MFVFVILMAACLVDCTVTAYCLQDKPFYNLEDAENLFKDFIKEHEKLYSPEDYKLRLEIFKKTLEDINDRNARHPQTVFAVNHFADLTSEEREQYLGFKPSNSNGVSVDLPNVLLPESFDWRDKGVVSPVQDQGNCGSSSIFSAIGSIEGQYAIKHHQCPDLSERQVIDCVKEGGRCNVGVPHKIMKALAKRAGVMTEADYRSNDTQDGTCHENPSKVLAHVTGGTALNISDENALMQALAKYGPLSVGLNADEMASYHSGILNCTGQLLNHAAVLVGFGEENQTKFWIIKNSWGVKWGEKGYLRLLRGNDACEMGTGYTATATVA